MRRFLIIGLLLVCASANARAALTTITQTIKNPDGTTFNGTLEIALNENCTQGDGTFVFAETKRVPVANGAFTVQLYPNSTCTPSGTSYFVRYQSRGNIIKAESWVVGTSTPTTIDAVRSSIIPSPSLFVSPSQISQGGAVAGQILKWNGYNWAAGDLTGVSVTSIFGRTGAVTAQSGDYSFSLLSGTATVGQLPAAGGDISGTLTAATVAKLQGRTLASTLPTNGQAVAWNNSLAQWEPTSVALSFNGRTGAVVPTTGDYSFSNLSGAATTSQLPSGIDATKIGGGLTTSTEFGYLHGVTSALQTQIDGKSATSHSHTLAGDVTGDVGATVVGKIQGRTVVSTAPADGQIYRWNAAMTRWDLGSNLGVADMTGQADKVLSNNGSASDWRGLGGDISGAPQAVTVGKIQGRAIATTAPSTGQSLNWNATNSNWEPKDPPVGLPSQTGFAGYFLKTDGSGASWSNIDKIQGRAFSSLAPAVGQVPKWDGTQWKPDSDSVGSAIPSVTGNANKTLTNDGVNAYWATPTTDLSAGTYSAGNLPFTVTGIQGRAVASTAPSNAQVLVWNSTTSAWEPQNQAAGSGEANTASNTGTQGTGLFKSKTGVDLAFYKIASANSLLTVGLSGTDFLQLTVNEANLNVGNQSGTLGATHGGTGASTWLLGDLLYSDAANSVAKLAGNTSATRKFLRQTGTGTSSAAPAWDTLVVGDIPDISATYQVTSAKGAANGYAGLDAGSKVAAANLPEAGAAASGIVNQAAQTFAGAKTFTGLGTFTPPAPTWAGLSSLYTGVIANLNSFPSTERFGGGTIGLVEDLVGAIDIPSTADYGNHSTGVAGYARTTSTSVGAVGLYGQGSLNAAGSAWGLNTRTLNKGFAGNLYGAEIDINNNGAASAANIRGMVLIGDSDKRPATGVADAFRAESLGVLVNPKIRWKTAFASADGAADVALLAGTARTSYYNVTNCTNATPIVVSVTEAVSGTAYHDLNTGDSVVISGVTGNTACNGTKTITVVNSQTFSLNGTTGNGAYVSGGTALLASVGSQPVQFNSRKSDGTLVTGSILSDASGNLLAYAGSGGIFAFLGDGGVTARLKIYPNASGGMVAVDGTTNFQLGSTTFAALGTPANGTMIYCSDCNSTCSAGSSTGKFCGRVNGAWAAF